MHKPGKQKVAILVSYLLYNNSIITNALLLQYLYPYINYLPLRSSIRPGVRLAQAEKPSFGRFCHSPGQDCSLFMWIVETLPQFVINDYRQPTSKIEKFLWESVWSEVDVLARALTFLARNSARAWSWTLAFMWYLFMDVYRHASDLSLVFTS
jgi:hypothetical protein